MWFLVSCIARGFQRLAITTLELTTIRFIVTTIGVSIVWFHKPADIETHKTIEIDATISDILAKAGKGDTYHWYETPLEFLRPERDYAEVCFRYCFDILSGLLMSQADRPRPIKWRRDDNFPIISHSGVVIVGIAGIISYGINLVAWNFDFPTIFERHAWRVCSLICGVAVLVGEVLRESLLYIFPDAKKKAEDRFAASKQSISIQAPKQQKTKFAERFRRQSHRFIIRLSNISPNGDPSLTLQIGVLLPVLFCGSAYVIARIYLLVEDFIAFRGQTPDVYKTVDWVNFLPHV